MRLRKDMKKYEVVEIVENFNEDRLGVVTLSDDLGGVLEFKRRGKVFYISTKKFNDSVKNNKIKEVA